MAQLELQPAEASKTKRRVHVALRVDMTPMVDLGFLLITFFILTTTLGEKNKLSLVMPKDGGEPIEIPASKSLTVLLGSNNKVYAYEGLWDDAYRNNKIKTVDYGPANGIRNVIIAKQKQLRQAGQAGKLTVLIKPLNESSYNNAVNLLDEMLINDVKTYAIVDPIKEEMKYGLMK